MIMLGGGGAKQQYELKVMYRHCYERGVIVEYYHTQSEK